MPKMVFALFAKSRRPTMCERIGAESYALTTTTRPERYADFYATTATLQSGTEKTKTHYSVQSNTSEFILDCVTNIVASGRDEVFDVQVAKTENFIADGFVSHNTRWHEDDLAGRLLAAEAGWKCLRLPAVAEPGDELGRAPGEALWPEWQRAEDIERRRLEVGERAFAAMYQQTPLPPDAAFFNAARVRILPEAPPLRQVIRGWDLAASLGSPGRSPDYTVGLKLGVTAENLLVVLDVARLQAAPAQVEAKILEMARLDGAGTVIALPQDPGQAGAAQIAMLTRSLNGYRVVASPERDAPRPYAPCRRRRRWMRGIWRCWQHPGTMRCWRSCGRFRTGARMTRWMRSPER